MYAWLVYSHKDYERNKWFATECIKVASKYGIELELKYLDNFLFGNSSNSLELYYDLKKINKPDFAIIRTMTPEFSTFLEKLGIACINSAHISRICNDKSATYNFAISNGINTIPSIYSEYNKLPAALTYIFENYDVNEAVIKSVDGHGGTQVFLLDKNKCSNTDDFIPDDIKKSKFCVQPRIGSKPKDLRIYVLGNKIYASMLRHCDSGFRANFCLGGKVCEYSPDEYTKNIVNKIIKLLNPDFIGIDFIIDNNNKIIFNEIEDVVGTRMLYEIGNNHVIDDYMLYISRKMQYYQF